jgi:hypothetical protein
MPSARRTISSVRRPDASWRHTTNHKIATETRAIICLRDRPACWPMVPTATKRLTRLSGLGLSNPAREKPTIRGEAMSEKSNAFCCFLATRPHFSQNFRRCDGRPAVSRWPDVTNPPGPLKSPRATARLHSSSEGRPKRWRPHVAPRGSVPTKLSFSLITRKTPAQAS